MDELSTEELAKLTTSELVEMSSQVREQIQNEDWQRLVNDLRTSGHIHLFRESAPPLLQRFLKLEIDLAEELRQIAPAAPLLSSIVLAPPRPRGDERRLVATLSSQDTGAVMQVEIFPEHDRTVFGFTIKNMLTFRFNLPHLDQNERQAYLEDMRREHGFTVLWTRERWEHDYLIFVKQEFFTRVFAYAASFEATARLTNEVTGQLLDWLERCWFPRHRDRRRSKRSTQFLSLEENVRELQGLGGAAPTTPPPLPEAGAAEPPASQGEDPNKFEW